jgi:hypothetical protein
MMMSRAPAISTMNSARAATFLVIAASAFLVCGGRSAPALAGLPVGGQGLHRAERLVRPLRTRRGVLTGGSLNPCGAVACFAVACGEPVTETVGARPTATNPVFPHKGQLPHEKSQPSGLQTGLLAAPGLLRTAAWPIPGGSWPRRARPARTPQACGRRGQGCLRRFGG